MAVTEERSRTRGDRVRAGRGTARPRASGTARRNREPQLTRTRSRASGMVAATTGLLGLSSTRRAAVLAVVVCALALTVAVPLRNFVAQRQELAEVSEQQRVLAAQVDELTRQRAQLSDPEQVVADARSRLGYVRPGEVPYVVQLPPPPDTGPALDPFDGVPWYQRLWHEVGEGPR
ncbi:septum formation initiator family protein [Pseudonocardia sp. H11422]|uniref:FtsB family cell division protein n=1 Tax=Pseudonocardia sp. H11422 TaxID=2835866 RepID=UPI0027E24431|nr:septum formation initiator family protein [Pseudonocardia sp. H11422]